MNFIGSTCTALPKTTPTNSTAWYVIEMSISKYPAEICTVYITSV